MTLVEALGPVDPRDHGKVMVLRSLLEELASLRRGIRALERTIADRNMGQPPGGG